MTTNELRPSRFIWVGIAMLAFVCITFPPTLALVIPGLLSWWGAKRAKVRRARRHHQANLEAWHRYHVEWQARQASVTNPGWRL